MAKRYFYTDPLKAVWMSREFNIKFQELVSYMVDERFEDRFIDLYSDKLLDNNFYPSMGRFYVHLDSEHLLEVQIGDIILTKDENYQFPNWVAEIDKGKLYTKHYDCNKQWIGGIHCKKIIQRNGKAFFTPESEEV